MDNQFYSHGKLLITGEFFVLKGALALALPLKLGQLTVLNKHDNVSRQLMWKSFYRQHLWFQATFNPDNFEIINASEQGKAIFVQNLLIKAFELANAKSKFTLSTIEILNHLEFHPSWGFGSSSTLISNISQWLQINPYVLLKHTIGGSGFDIACATAPKPLIYSNIPSPRVELVDFKPSFSDSIYFVNLGNKVSSSESISKFAHLPGLYGDKLQKINQLTQRIVNSQTLEQFELLLNEHNRIISDTLNLIPLQVLKFSDFPGTIKQLGAWGGDFILAACNKGEKFVKEYFNTKDLSVIYKFHDLIL